MSVVLCSVVLRYAVLYNVVISGIKCRNEMSEGDDGDVARRQDETRAKP